MIETKKALATILKTASRVVTSIKDDNKIDFAEGISIAGNALGFISIFKNLPEIKNEIKAATEEDIAGLVEEFKADFDIPNDDLELKVEQGIEILTKLAVMVFKNAA